MGYILSKIVKSIVKIKSDLACVVDDKLLEISLFRSEHLFTLFSSKCKYSISKTSFDEFIKLIYIEKNAHLFKGMVKMSLPKNVNSWKKSDLITAFNALDISTKGDNGKDLLVQALKQKILNYLEQNEADLSF